MPQPTKLTERQQREIEYHREFAKSEHACKNVAFDILRPKRRSWFNASWSMYTDMLRARPENKRVLVVGCGFGEDAIRLARCGAEVFAFDISEDVLNVAKALADKYNLQDKVHFRQCSAEDLPYDDNVFDWIVARDILHHVEIPQTMTQLARVAKAGGKFFANEVYSHTITKPLRNNYLTEKILYPRLKNKIYQGKTPYITSDERKCNQRDIAEIKKFLSTCRSKYFSFMCGRLISPANITAAKIDRSFLRSIGPAGKFLAGRIVINGHF